MKVKHKLERTLKIPFIRIFFTILFLFIFVIGQASKYISLKFAFLGGVLSVVCYAFTVFLLWVEYEPKYKYYIQHKWK